MSRRKESSDTSAPAKPPRDKAKAFVRLVNRRLGKGLKCLRDIIPLANRAAYTYGQAQVEYILDQIHQAYQDLQRAFAGQAQARPTVSCPSLMDTNGSVSEG